MIEIISATRMNEQDFWNTAALGISLRRLAQDTRLLINIAFENKRGLPEIFNAHINDPKSAAILVFIHDDVWIDDFFFGDRIIHGLKTYDVIGVAGNKRRVLQQPAWAFVNDKFTWDDRANLSGSVAHGQQPFGPVSTFGPSPTSCELLDGVFLAAKRSRLQATNVSFDAQFSFHFYDMDFCRSARNKGLRLGTWPICLTHQSGGAFGSENWLEKYKLYLNKWKS